MDQDIGAGGVSNVRTDTYVFAGRRIVKAWITSNLKPAEDRELAAVAECAIIEAVRTWARASTV